MTKDTKTEKSQKPAKAPKVDKKDQLIQDLTADLQRVRADFENYRKRVELEKEYAKKSGAEKTVLDLLPVIDNIDRAVSHVPGDIAEQPWVKGIASLTKQLDKTLSKLGLARIDASEGATFDPNLHQAVQFEEDAEGEKEVVAKELQPGYLLNDNPIRYSMVRVTRQ